LNLQIVSGRPMVDDIERRIELVLACIPDMIRIDDIDGPFGECAPEVV
jgi:hypothetical protein